MYHVDEEEEDKARWKCPEVRDITISVSGVCRETGVHHTPVLQK
jgi:hypothetical protein